MPSDNDVMVNMTLIKMILLLYLKNEIFKVCGTDYSKTFVKYLTV
jgi:hypothetical protein